MSLILLDCHHGDPNWLNKCYAVEISVSYVAPIGSAPHSWCPAFTINSDVRLRTIAKCSWWSCLSHSPSVWTSVLYWNNSQSTLRGLVTSTRGEAPHVLDNISYPSRLYMQPLTQLLGYFSMHQNVLWAMTDYIGLLIIQNIFCHV